LVALSNEAIPMPNIIVHFARMVHTPVGSAASGMPKVMGFVSSVKEVGDYFGANVFAGTPFEAAPTIIGDIKIETNLPDSATATVKIEGYEIVLELSSLGELSRVSRQSPNLPFHDDSLESAAGSVKLTVNGEEMFVIVPPVGMSGGAAAVFSASGFYSR
jgi:hypothetical protein